MPAQFTPVTEEYMSAVVHFVGMSWTCKNAFTAIDAALGSVTKFGSGILSFRIVAPETTHGASFQEHRGADARPIVQGKSLNIEDDIGYSHCNTVQGGNGMVRKKPILLSHPVFIRSFFAEIQEDGKLRAAQVWEKPQKQNAVSHMKQLQSMNEQIFGITSESLGRPIIPLLHYSTTHLLLERLCHCDVHS
jgi:hypothetical protein